VDQKFKRRSQSTSAYRFHQMIGGPPPNAVPHWHVIPLGSAFAEWRHVPQVAQPHDEGPEELWRGQCAQSGLEIHFGALHVCVDASHVIPRATMVHRDPSTVQGRFPVRRELRQVLHGCRAQVEA
jgi:hypothetical protein